MIDWNQVNPHYFEKFVQHVLGIVGFKNREWYGRGGSDKGRDVCATWYEQVPFGLAYERKWIFQCKKWRRMPTTLQVYEEITKAIQHKADHWVMIIPLNPSSNIIDYIASLEKNFQLERMKLDFVPLAQIEELLFKHPELRNVLVEGVIENERS